MKTSTTSTSHSNGKSLITGYDNIILNKLDTHGHLSLLHSKPLFLELFNQVPESQITFSEDKRHKLFKYSINQKDFEFAKLGSDRLIINTNTDSICLKFSNSNDKASFISELTEIRNGPKKSSLFDKRTDETSATQYFQFYGLLSQQQNMMQDYIRTATYQRAILDNLDDFKGKVVLDVGAGSGILSFFAVQAGAAKVYAIEASSMAANASILVKENNLEDKIKIVAGKVEDVEIPELVDTIISEPMGYMLLNERMLESFLHARKFLKPGGKMFPTKGDLYAAPFTDEVLYMEQVGKANFWNQTCFYGVDLSSLKNLAHEEYFNQPIVDTFDPRVIVSKPVKYTIDFTTSKESDLFNIDIPLKFDTQTSSVIHGLAFWFDVVFDGSTTQTWLSTAPTQPLTHWYQVRCLFPQPLLVTKKSILTGKIELRSNKKQSYDVNMVLTNESTKQVFKNTLDLKNPYFRYNGAAGMTPGQYHESPTEAYLNQTIPEQTKTPEVPAKTETGSSANNKHKSSKNHKHKGGRN